MCLRPIFPQMSPVFPQKSTIFPPNSPILSQIGSVFLQKSSLFLQKSDLYFREPCNSERDGQLVTVCLSLCLFVYVFVSLSLCVSVWDCDMESGLTQIKRGTQKETHKRDTDIYMERDPRTRRMQIWIDIQTLSLCV